jgi:vacuolar-type H+-ATPase subunit D/Vma8
MLKRDNRKANEEVFDKKLNFALDNQKQYLELQAEVDKVKQRIDYLEKDVIDNYQLTCQKFDEIKKTLQDIYDKINQHIHISHIK